MPRIAVIGNCQAMSVADVIKCLIPNAFVKTILAWEAHKWVSSYEAFIEDMRTFDVVFSHDVTIGNFSDGSLHNLKRDIANVVEMPIIVFPAFHPDLVYASVKSGQGLAPLHSPVGVYNSAIALFAYMRNYSVAETIKLYNEAVFERLGYFAFWNSSREALLETGKKAGLDLRESFARWARGGCFMHSINHAKIEALGDLATLLLKKAGLRIHESHWRPFVPDPAQTDAVWPVYPEIGEKLGIPGCYVFRRPDHASQGHQSYLTLDAFVAGSFESYRFFPQARMTCERVDRWLEDKALVEFMDETASRR